MWFLLRFKESIAPFMALCDAFISTCLPMCKFLHMVVTFLSSFFFKWRNTYYLFVLCSHYLSHNKCLIISVICWIQKWNVMTFLNHQIYNLSLMKFQTLLELSFKYTKCFPLREGNNKSILNFKNTCILRSLISKYFKILCILICFKTTSVISLHFKIWEL